MKLRIVEDLEGCGNSRWFRLERHLPATNTWLIVDSGTDVGRLEHKAEWLVKHPEPIRVVKEFTDESQSLVDIPPQTE